MCSIVAELVSSCTMQDDRGVLGYLLLGGVRPLYTGGQAGTATTHGAATFSQWFAPVSQLPANRWKDHQIPLT